MGLEYIAQPQVFLSPISAEQGIRGLIENYPLLTTFQSWTSTTGAATSSLQIGGFWTMLEKPSLTGEVVPESFIVTVGGVVQAPDSYRIFNYPIRKIDFTSILPQGIEVNLTQLATHAPSSQRFSYLRADSALINNLTATTVVFVTAFTVTENLSAFTVTDIIAQNTLSAGIINTGSINSSTILSAGTNLYNLFVPVVGGTITSNSSNPALRITQSGSGNALLVEDEGSDASPFVIDANGRVGIGTTALSQALTLETTVRDGVQVIRTSSDTTPSTLLLSKARGTPSAKTTVTQNDVLGQVVFQGWDNVGSFNPAASIESIVSGTVGLSTVPAHLIFKTNTSSTTPSERLRITSSGNVGIGVTDPSTRLTVSGGISASGEAQTSNITIPALSTEPRFIEVGLGRQGSGFAYIDFIGDTTYADYGLRLIRYNSGQNTDSGLEHRGAGVLNITTVDTGSISFKTNSNTRVTVTSSGNVGIGTITPNESLTVVGDVSAAGTVWGTGIGAFGQAFVATSDRSASNWARMDFVNQTWITNTNNNNYGVLFLDQAGNFTMRNNGPGTLQFATSATDSSAPLTRLLISNTGNVGIGTTSPPFRLTVANNTTDGFWTYSSGISSIIGLGGYSTGTDGAAGLIYNRSLGDLVIFNNTRDSNIGDIRISSNGDMLFGNNKAIRLGSTNGYTTNLSGGNIFKFTDNNLYIDNYDKDIIIRGPGAARRITITESGNVGIGSIASPGERLTVVGNISASGSIQSGGFSVPRKFATSITGSATSYTVTHNLGTRDVVVSVYDNASPFDVVLTSIAHTSTNTVTVDLDPAPGSKTYRVVVIG